jgi:hypothetical protein
MLLLKKDCWNLDINYEVNDFSKIEETVEK